MFEIDYKSIKKGRKLFYIFLVVGIILTAIFLLIFINSITKKNSLKGKVSADYIEPNQHYDDDGSVLYSPVYHYTVNGKEYECGTSGVSSSKRPGSSGVVYYNIKNPSDCMTDYNSSISYFLLIGVGLGVVFGVIGGIGIYKNQKEVNKAKLLSTKGKLIKGIPYIMEPTSTVVNGRRIEKIAIDYNLPSGSIVHLTGNPRYDGKFVDSDGLVDLLIDPDDPTNYFIDFEIKYSGDVQVENYSGPGLVNNQPMDNGMSEKAEQIAQAVQNTANFAQKVENTINTANAVFGSGTITIGGNNNNNNDTNNHHF